MMQKRISMYDIKINENGSCVFDSRGVVFATFEEYVGQLIYSAAMQTSLELFSGKRVSDIQSAMEEVRARVVSKITSPLIDTSAIKVTIAESQGGRAQFSITYTGYNPETRTSFSYTSPLRVSVEGGAYTSVDLSPEWLTLATLSEEADVSVHVTVTEPTRTVRLPGVPTCVVYGADGAIAHSVFLTDGTPVELTEEVVDIQVQPEVKTYLLQRYASGTVAAATLRTATPGAQIVKVNGDYTLFYRGSTVSTVQCALIVTNALQATTDVKLEKTSVDGVYPLSPLRTVVNATFERVVAPGRYVVQYKELREVK